MNLFGNDDFKKDLKESVEISSVSKKRLISLSFRLLFSLSNSLLLISKAKICLNPKTKSLHTKGDFEAQATLVITLNIRSLILR